MAILKIVNEIEGWELKVPNLGTVHIYHGSYIIYSMVGFNIKNAKK